MHLRLSVQLLQEERQCHSENTLSELSQEADVPKYRTYRSHWLHHITLSHLMQSPNYIYIYTCLYLYTCVEPYVNITHHMYVYMTYVYTYIFTNPIDDAGSMFFKQLSIFETWICQLQRNEH